MKIRNCTVAVAVASILGLGLAGCSGESSASTSDEDLTFGLINSANNEWGSCMQGGVESAAKKDGITLHTANSDADAGKEVSNVEDMISRQVDAILMNTVSVDSLEGSIQLAKAADIPIYLIAVMPEDGLDEVLGATVVDLPGVGEQAADWVAKDADGKNSKAAIVAGAPGASSDLTAKGFEDSLPDTVELVANQPGMYNRSEAMSVAENVIEAHADLDYAFVLNEDMAFGVRKAFDTAGHEDVKVVTMNGTDEGIKAVEDGDFSATVADSASELGSTAVASASALLGDSEQEKITQMETPLITEDNLEDAIPFCG